MCNLMRNNKERNEMCENCEIWVAGKVLILVAIQNYTWDIFGFKNVTIDN